MAKKMTFVISLGSCFFIIWLAKAPSRKAQDGWHERDARASEGSGDGN